MKGYKATAHPGEDPLHATVKTIAVLAAHRIRGQYKNLEVTTIIEPEATWIPELRNFQPDLSVTFLVKSKGVKRQVLVEVQDKMKDPRHQKKVRALRDMGLTVIEIDLNKIPSWDENCEVGSGYINPKAVMDYIQDHLQGYVPSCANMKKGI